MMHSTCTVHLARHFLRFRHPFGTAHGIRTGTETLLLRIEHQGRVGYGEVALPPYVSESVEQAIDDINTIDIQDYILISLKSITSGSLPDGPFRTKAARALVTMALYSLIFKNIKELTSTLDTGYVRPALATSYTLATVGMGDVRSIAHKISELPDCGAIKVKLVSGAWEEILAAVVYATEKPLLLDGNQGLSGIEEVLRIIGSVGAERLLGIEQPFGRDDLEMHLALSERAGVPIYADESIQDLRELEERHRSFTGVNLKLTKCGGLDRASAMMRAARERGMAVMLGCMSEGSLGCAAMSSLQSGADLVDLDGPWLVANDLFGGLAMGHRAVYGQGGLGFGVDLVEQPNWMPVGA